MGWVYIEQLSGHIGEEVTLRGWLYNRRSSGKVHFLLIRDGTGICQCVASVSDIGQESFAAADHIGRETSLELSGLVREDRRAPGGIELSLKSLRISSQSADYPITPKEHGVAFLLDHRHLWVRSSRQHAILRVRSEVEAACRDFFHERGFVLFDAPILTPTSCDRLGDPADFWTRKPWRHGVHLQRSQFQRSEGARRSNHQVPVTFEAERQLPVPSRRQTVRRGLEVVISLAISMATRRNTARERCACRNAVRRGRT